MLRAHKARRSVTIGVSGCPPHVSAIAIARGVVGVATGLRGEAKLVVTEADTAIALGSGRSPCSGRRGHRPVRGGELPGLAGELPAGRRRSGSTCGLDHLQPSAPGAEVIAEAVLVKVDGRRLTFTVSASDERGLVAVGKVVRAVVDVQRFMSKCGRSA